MTTTTTDATTTPGRRRRRGLRTRTATAAAMTVTTLIMAVMFAGPAAAATNPLGGITPSLDFLGPTFNSVWARLAASIWGLLLAGSAVKLLASIYKMRAARSGGYAAEMTDAMAEAKVAGIAFGALAAGGVIVGAILFVTNQGGA